jgi:predicted ribosome quality control (RQC) complex YloA/Tae2 family protein
LDKRLAGAVIHEAFCQSKNELLVSLSRDSDGCALLVSCEPSANFLFLRGEVHRAKKNSIDVFSRIWGQRVEQVFIQPADREIVVRCSGDTRVMIQLFGSKANVFLVDAENRIVDAFLRPKETVGATYRPKVRDLAEVPHTPKDFTIRLQAIGNILLSAAVKKLFPLLNSVLIREVCYHASLNDRQLVAELQEGDQQRLYGSILNLIEQLEGLPAPRLYYQNVEPESFSLVPLVHLKATREERFDSLHEAIRTFLGKSRKHKSLLHEKERLVRYLERAMERAGRTLEKIAEESELLERAAQYELSGKLLMANLHRIEPRTSQASVENVFSPARETITIRLDPGQSPARNAERYFEKAKKARGNVEEKTKHKDETVQEWEGLRDLVEHLLPIQTPERFADFLAAHDKDLAQVGYKAEVRGADQPREQVPFRIFTVAGGFAVWVGKSSENNDLLTLKYAKPNDLWLHARGSSGSHVVLKTGTGKGQPSKRAIDEAASIAAYYSKMKNAKYVPVAVTERKYVRKPRGASPGTVTIEREKLVFVEPRLPTGDQQN